MRREQKPGARQSQTFRGHDLSQPLPESPVSNLVVVLQKADESGRGQVSRRLAARFATPVGRRLALVGETLGKAPSEARHGPVLVVHIVAVEFASQERVPAMMEVVIPLRGVEPRIVSRVARQPTRLVGIVLEDQMGPDGPAWSAARREHAPRSLR
jgi:hypothetical protein